MPVELRGYQHAAVEAIIAGLSGGGRGQVHAACGTGKTLVAARAAAGLCRQPGDVVVVACPSLSLVGQTAAVWVADGVAVQVLAACGDDTVADAITHLDDLPCPVTTDPGEIAGWLRRPYHGLRLVVTTHVSAGVVGEGLLQAGVTASLLVVDEAHHTAGRAGKHVAVVHDDERLPALRRLYLTATPRFIAAGVVQRRGDDATVSMDDDAVFGSVLYAYPFGKAIADGWLDDYQVAVIGVTSAEGLAVLRSVDEEAVASQDQPPLRMAVVHTALARAQREFDLRRVIAFTPRVGIAREFARFMPRTLAGLPGSYQPERQLTAMSVDGTMTMRQRRLILNHLEEPPGDGWAVVANARCLSEGVDVPAVDGVVFTHPKRSTVDVIQAVGRALRRNPHGSGIATVLVPVLLPDSPEAADMDADVDRSYATLWQVLRALRAHDETLAAELDAQRMNASTGGAVELPSRLLVRLPDGYDTDQFLQALTIRLVRSASSAWLEGYAAAQAYHAERGDLRVLYRHVTPGGYPLGAWITRQRQDRAKGRLTADRVASLDALGMVWDEFDTRWQAGVAALRAFRAEHGHLWVPQGFLCPDGFRLGTWVSNQRSKRSGGLLSQERVAELDALGMPWDSSDWARGLAALRAFRDRTGHARVPKQHVEAGMRLDEWINSRRGDRRRGALDADRVAALDELGLVWEPHEAHWERGLAAARQFHAEHGHLRPPAEYGADGGLKLKTWLDNKRSAYRAGKLDADKVSALEALGIEWNPYDSDWERGLAAARSYHAEHGHLRPPAKTWHGGVQLSAWVTRRRREFRESRLPADRIAALDEIGMLWQVGRGSAHAQRDRRAAAEGWTCTVRASK